MSILSDYFARLLPVIENDLQAVLTLQEGFPAAYYHMLHYHMGWVDEHGQPADIDRGKRLRPLLSLLVSETVSGNSTPARPPAAAVELIHNFSLLHDDIQDRSPTRRNRPTVWCVWDEKQAINAGDAMFALAHLAIPRLSDGKHPERLVRMLTILDETCMELTRGQHLDISFEDRGEISTDEYLNMIAGKTAALLSASAQLGAIAAGADDTHYAAFGHNLGMAFQVLDDILDIWGDPELIGKKASIDIWQRKKSLPVLYGLSHSEELHERYANQEPFTGADVEHIKDLLDEVGARRYAEDLARQYSEQTMQHLNAANAQGQAGAALRELVDMLLHRKK